MGADYYWKKFACDFAKGVMMETRELLSYVVALVCDTQSCLLARVTP
jgi:hypothetical protein